MPRRGSNIYKRKDGRFEGRVPIGHKEDGSLKYKFVYARTLSEVKEKMAQFQAVLQSQPVSALKLTVAEASRQWLSAAKLRVKPSSYAHYENIIRNHILPDLGTKYLTDMTTHQLNDFVFEKLQSGRLCGTGGLSARFVQDIMRVYHSIEQYAVQEYHIHGTHFTMPKAEKKQLDVLSSEERKKLEQYLLQTGLTVDLAILLCLFTGLRVGELCGLQWSDIDFENGTLSVKRTVQRVYRNGLFRGTDWLSQKQNFCADNSGSVLLVNITGKEKASGFSVPDYWKEQTGRTENDAVSVSENPETLWYPEGSISSASTHLCYRLYCPWV